MDKTKFWLVTKNEYSDFSIMFGSYRKTIGLYSEKIEAEFSAHKNGYCDIMELEIQKSIDKTSKEFKKFLEQKKEDIQKQITKARECRDGDITKINTLNEELNKYNENR